MSEDVDKILDAARIRGRLARKAMIEEAGGLLTTKQAALAAGITQQALLRRRNKSLLAVPANGRLGWPKFQFENRDVMRAVGEVMECFDIQSPWMKLCFFLVRFEELGGIRPIDAIKAGDIRGAKRAAAHLGVHGAT